MKRIKTLTPEQDQALANKFMLANAIFEVMSKDAATRDEAEAQLMAAAELIEQYENNKQKIEVRNVS